MDKTETLFGQLDSLVVKLVQRHGVSHDEIKKRIFKSLSLISEKLPKLKVLYNSIHGGYGYSEQFTYFVNGVHDNIGNGFNKDVRMEHVQKVKEFGDVCIKKYPFVSKLITLYKHYSLADVFCSFQKLKYAEDEIKRMTNAIAVIEEADDDLFGNNSNCRMSLILYNFSLEKVIQYNKNYLLKLLDAQLKSSRTIVKENKGLIETLIGLNNYQRLSQFSMQNEDKGTFEHSFESWDKRLGHNGLVNISFLDAIERYGETHFAIWKCQNYFNKKAMAFLVQYHDCFRDENNDNDEVDVEMGLLCASSAYCKLEIGQAPQILSWYIGEYDGCESIVVKP